MNESNDDVKLLRSAPYFPVTDVDRSVEFYSQILGFQYEYKAGAPARFAICSRDGLAIMLRLISDPAMIVPNEKQGGTWDAFFWVKGMDELYKELKANGAAIVYGPIIQEKYQMKEFAVRDCDGHILGFGQSLNT